VEVEENRCAVKSGCGVIWQYQTAQRYVEPFSPIQHSSHVCHAAPSWLLTVSRAVCIMNQRCCLFIA